MQAFMCTVCGYLYDDETAEKNLEGVTIEFRNLDPEWTCPVCGVQQDLFEPFDSSRIIDKPVE
jgi:rubredoxin